MFVLYIFILSCSAVLSREYRLQLLLQYTHPCSHLASRFGKTSQYSWQEPLDNLHRQMVGCVLGGVTPRGETLDIYMLIFLAQHFSILPYL